MNFETTIGLEVHVELKTNSKIFSPSPVNFGAAPNANTNVIDWGYPGVLPSINKGVVRDGIMAALALHAKVTKKMHFDRKNYFYPDNPKAYQITQSETPIAHDGWVEIEFDGGSRFSFHLICLPLSDICCFCRARRHQAPIDSGLLQRGSEKFFCINQCGWNYSESNVHMERIGRLRTVGDILPNLAK